MRVGPLQEAAVRLREQGAHDNRGRHRLPGHLLPPLLRLLLREGGAPRGWGRGSELEGVISKIENKA